MFFEGLFPRDSPKNTRFAINFFEPFLSEEQKKLMAKRRKKRNLFSMSFQYTPEYEIDEVYFAFCVPYTVHNLRTYLDVI